MRENSPSGKARASRMPVVSARRMRRLLSLYPPLFFNRIVPVSLAEDFSRCEVRIYKSWLNRNINGTIFGGTLACAADPWHGVMYFQRLVRRRREVQVWVRASSMDFRAPGATDLSLLIEVSDADLSACEQALDAQGRYTHTYEIPIRDTSGATIAMASIVVHVRQTPAHQQDTVGF